VIDAIPLSLYPVKNLNDNDNLGKTSVHACSNPKLAFINEIILGIGLCNTSLGIRGYCYCRDSNRVNMADNKNFRLFISEKGSVINCLLSAA
jgi:hypothetical protein